MGEAEYFKRDKEDIALDQNKLTEIEKELEQAYQRWEELDS